MAGEVRIVGTRSFAGEVADYARDAGLEIAGLLEPIDPDRIGTTIHGLPVQALEERPEGDGLVIIGTGESDRRAIVARAKQAGWQPVSLTHPRAHVAPSATVREGALIGPGVVVGAYTSIGDHVVLGRGSLVGHHTEIGAFCTLGPGANVAGNVRVERDAFLGMAAVVRDHVTIGRQSTVAMGAVVVADVETGSEVRGIPARPRPAATGRP
jgi:sugar O-acyltransferase (sialic acid O-acetyltransferase NeuD family)